MSDRIEKLIAFLKESPADCFLNHALAHWREEKYSLGDEPVLLAVSGGIDSMVMADLVLKSNIRFGIAHCNFGLRGEASDLDEQLVREWCNVHEIKFHHTLFDTK